MSIINAVYLPYVLNIKSPVFTEVIKFLLKKKKERSATIITNVIKIFLRNKSRN